MVPAPMLTPLPIDGIAEIASGGWPCCRRRAARSWSRRSCRCARRRRARCPGAGARTGRCVTAPSVRAPSRSQCARTSVPDGEHDVLQAAERTDAHAVAEHDVAFEDRRRHRSRHRARRYTLPRMSTRAGSAKRTPSHAQRAHRAQLERAFELRELPRIVGAFGFHRVGDQHDLRGAEFGRGLREHVGEVVLALRVVVAQRVQPALQRGGFGGDHAGVDQADRALLVARRPCARRSRRRGLRRSRTMRP